MEDVRRYRAMIQVGSGTEFVEAEAEVVLASDYDALREKLARTHDELEAARLVQAIQWDDCSEDTIKSLRNEVHALREALHCRPVGHAEGWDDAYAAFVGAFDTPVARRKFSDEYAEDARRRLRAINEAVRDSQPLAWATGSIVWGSAADAQRHADTYGLAIKPLFDSPFSIVIKESEVAPYEHP